MEIVTRSYDSYEKKYSDEKVYLMAYVVIFNSLPAFFVL